jgi:uncharacterized protein (DUF111 family)
MLASAFSAACRFAKLGLPSCRLVVQETKKCGFRATQLTVEHEPEHKHRHLHHIEAMIAAARTAIAAIQMTDPMAPEQELGEFTIGRVSGQQPPSRTHPDPDPIQADAE